MITGEIGQHVHIDLATVHHVNTTATGGDQAVSRASAVLRAVGRAPAEGLTTTELAAATGINRSTAHRIASALARDGLLDRPTTTGRWLLGPETYLLGAVAARRYDVTALARDVVRSLAGATGESAFYSVRRGDETVCLLREEGSFPLRSFVLHEGVRFPLGVASAGLAILAHLPTAEAERYLTAHDLTAAWGEAHGDAALRERLRQTRTDGYATNPALLVEGSWGMGAAVFDHTGEPSGALSLTGVETRFGPERRRVLGRLLLDHAHRLSQGLAQRAARSGQPV